MSSFLATVLVLGIYALALVPLVALVMSPRARPAIGAGYVAAIVGIGLWQTGIFHRATLADVDVAMPTLATADEARCRQVFALLDQSGLRVRRDESGTMEITGVNSDELPPAVREAILSCAETLAPKTTATDSPSSGPV